MLGVFGLSIRTTERDLEDEFNRYGQVEKVTIVYDQRVSFRSVHIPIVTDLPKQSDRSRGFGFISMTTVDEAGRCIKELNGVVSLPMCVLVCESSYHCRSSTVAVSVWITL